MSSIRPRPALSSGVEGLEGATMPSNDTFRNSIYTGGNAPDQRRELYANRLRQEIMHRKKEIDHADNMLAETKKERPRNPQEQNEIRRYQQHLEKWKQSIQQQITDIENQLKNV